jgi:hypothetical protein
VTCLTCAHLSDDATRCAVYPRLALPFVEMTPIPQAPNPRRYPDDWCSQWSEK